MGSDWIGYALGLGRVRFDWIQIGLICCGHEIGLAHVGSINRHAFKFDLNQIFFFVSICV